MAYTDAVPTIAEIYQANKGIYDVTKFTNEPGLTFVDSGNKTKSTLAGLIKSINWNPVGRFSDGVTFNSINDFALDSSNVQWIYVGSDPFPKTVDIAFVPTAPNYQVIHVSDHNQLIGRNPANGSSHNSDDILVAVPSITTLLKKTILARIESASVVDFATEYLTQAEIDEINITYPTGALNTKPTIDITEKLIQAITDLGGSHDITTAFLYEPAKVLQLPAGVMGLNTDALERVLVNKNNIYIIGRGMFNTRICHIGTGNAQEMFRFKEAYACGLAHLTLDGGLPFNPVGTETYGCDVPLVTDQCAHFYSEGLNIVNYRVRGWQAIHLWESFLGNDLRIHNGGWFALGAEEPAGLAFDSYLKESTFFSGSESNQIYIGKYAFGGIGRLLHVESPVFNLHIEQVVSEGRTLGGYVPPQFGVSKVFISGLSAGIVVEQAWHYYHDQPSTIGASGTLFEFANAGQGCYFRNQVIYQEIPPTSVTNILEVDKLISNTSAHSVYVDLNISDNNSATSLFNGAAVGTLVRGDIVYRNSEVRDISSFMGANGVTGFIGSVSMSTGPFTTSQPIVYNYKGKSVDVSSIDGGGVFPEYACRAIANFHGGVGGGARMEKGITVTRDDVGQYRATFTDTMPDANYAVNLSFQASNLDDKIDLASITNTGFTCTVRDASGVYHDSGVVCMSVFR